MEIKKNVRNRIALCGWLGAAALCCLPVAHAKGGYSPAVNPAPGGFNIKFGSNGTPLAVPTNTPAGVKLDSPVTVNLGPTTAVQVAATAGIAGAAIGGPWGAAVGGLGAVAVFAIPAFAEIYNRAKLRVNPQTGVIEKVDESVCTVAPCVEYNYNVGGSYPVIWASTRAAACAATIPHIAAIFPAYNFSGSYLSGVTCTIYRFNKTTGAAEGVQTNGNGATRTVAPSPETYAPATLAQAQAAIAAVNPTWDQVQAMVDLGFPPDPGPVTITGPATVTDTNTTSLGLDGTRKDETCKFYLEYFPSNIKAHPECTVTTTTPEKTETKQETVTNPDGTTTTKTVTTVTPPKTETTTVVKDKLPQDTRTDCDKYPNSVGCQELDSPEGEIPKSTKNLTFTPENLGFGGGACPANIVQSIHGQSVTVFSYTKPCDIIRTYVAPLVLAISAFVAFMILTPGGRPE